MKKRTLKHIHRLELDNARLQINIERVNRESCNRFDDAQAAITQVKELRDENETLDCLLQTERLHVAKLEAEATEHTKHVAQLAEERDALQNKLALFEQERDATVQSLTRTVHAQEPIVRGAAVVSQGAHDATQTNATMHSFIKSHLPASLFDGITVPT